MDKSKVSLPQLAEYVKSLSLPELMKHINMCVEELDKYIGGVNSAMTQQAISDGEEKIETITTIYDSISYLEELMCETNDDTDGGS